ncbi:MAG TPA: right-handed parallel beta-helix repeat-containing protein [Verrucomicrobiae bacterium]|nr:right-handed parallel beta-helix repeat-containing protein [Verrucomicrobiae bacterium]
MITNRIMQMAAVLLLPSFVLQPSSLHAQGALTPAGAPASTMKSLDQIEPRTPVDAVHTPGFLNIQYAITQPGSYYLTGNITSVSNQSGIFIQTNDVTLDLNGFEMIGNSGYPDAIDVSSLVVRNTVIRNGSLRNWDTGVAALNGYCELDHVRVYGCTNYGFDLGDHCTVKNCTAVNNGADGGADNGKAIQLGNGCVVTDCLVSTNAEGISGGSDCVISGCIVISNQGEGVYLADNCNVSKCIADYNFGGFQVGNNGQIQQCTANGNGESGILTGLGCIIKACTANSNGFAGIVFNGQALVMDNMASGNDYGIASQGTGSRIENNQALNNIEYGINSEYGPDVDVVIRNTSSGNGTANYNPTNSTTFGPLQQPATATSPWANF